MERIEELLTEEMRDLYDAEKQLVKALPKMARAASDEELKQAFQRHLEETQSQVERLEQAFEILGQRARSKPCKGMKGLVEEGSEIMQEQKGEDTLDSALIGAAQKVEHYEIAGYGTARTWAQAMGNREVAQLLQQTLDEEGKTDKLLTQIAKRLLKEDMGAAAPAQGRGGKSRGASGRSRGSSAGGRAASRESSGGGRSGSRTTTDPDEIRRWAEERGAKPACVKGTGNKGDIGMLRLDFPGYSGGENLQPISWKEFFEKFEERGLALLYQEKTARGQKSNFNKIVSRETARAAG
jgi:ferritin-like metal-binding protein YciE